jgi:hypothetical protein
MTSPDEVRRAINTLHINQNRTQLEALYVLRDYIDGLEEKLDAAEIEIAGAYSDGYSDGEQGGRDALELEYDEQLRDAYDDGYREAIDVLSEQEGLR